jgi:hypothetical protein
MELSVVTATGREESWPSNRDRPIIAAGEPNMRHLRSPLVIFVLAILGIAGVFGITRALTPKMICPVACPRQQ